MDAAGHPPAPPPRGAQETHESPRKKKKGTGSRAWASSLVRPNCLRVDQGGDQLKVPLTPIIPGSVLLASGMRTFSRSSGQWPVAHRTPTTTTTTNTTTTTTTSHHHHHHHHHRPADLTQLSSSTAHCHCRPESRAAVPTSNWLLPCRSRCR
jgi:hypothetical protein